MQWIYISLALGLAAVVAIFAIVAKSHDGVTIHGHFDFDKYKSQELSKRGLFDKTKW